MKRRVFAIMLMLATSPVSIAASSWSQQSGGVTLSHGGQTATSPALVAPSGVAAALPVTYVAWRIELLTPPPANLKVTLCNKNRCVPLNGLKGRIKVTENFDVKGPFHFVYHVHGWGKLTPPLHVVQNALTVTYKKR